MPQHLKTANGASSKTSSLVNVAAVVQTVIQDIRVNGDAAVRKYSEQFDSWSPTAFQLSSEDIAAAIAAVPAQTIKDIKQVQANVRAFAQAQRDSLHEFELETQPGVFLGQRHNPLNRVGA
jgi:histidinol dehydrogenase